ncbi:MAG: hypothetical protein ACI8WB_002156 [Phenylobacterium sp.]|jgi:hypothetical protein
MKTLTKIATSLALLSGMFIGAVNAADIEAGVVKQVTTGDNGKVNRNIGTLDLSHLAITDGNKLAKESTFGPASGVSYYEVYAVGSSNVGWEYPSAAQTSTSYNHGGSILRMAVIQYGYGNPNQATMNGSSKSISSSEVLCGSMSSLHICGTGETVTGFLYYFDFSGQSNGQFVTSSNSIASPFGYWSDSIYIQ